MKNFCIKLFNGWHKIFLQGIFIIGIQMMKILKYSSSRDTPEYYIKQYKTNSHMHDEQK